jgi:hypothetical protein
MHEAFVTDPMTAVPSPVRLPILETAGTCYAALWTQRDDLLRVAAVPALATFGLNLLLAWKFDLGMAGDPLDPPEPTLGAYLVMLLALVPMTLFAVNWTRVLLLGRDSVGGLGLRWGVRESLYLLRALAIILAATLAGFIVAIPVVVVLTVLGIALGFLGGFGDGGVNVDQAAQQFGFVIGMVLGIPIFVIEIYLMFRLLLALPATAVDRPNALHLAWRSAKGTVGRLFLAYLLVVIPPYVAIFLLQFALGAAGLFTVAPFSAQLVGTILGFVAAAAGSSVLALAYHRLVGAGPSRTVTA